MPARVLKGIKSGAPNNLQTITAYVEPSLAQAKADEKFQFERYGYFVADRVEHNDGKAVFNRFTRLKGSWLKQKGVEHE
jgi:glutaminyl-tRNA synthetase